MQTSDQPSVKQLTVSDAELLTVEYALPRVERDLEEVADSERERYDEQILAALVAPSF
jgi:hypothetical protein